MKKFKCTICNYIHVGDNPPKRCPVCGSSQNKFVLLEAKKGQSEFSEIEENLNCDLVVVGSGAAALSAACFGHAKGLDVIVVEKADKFGGTTKRSGGRYWIPNNAYQKEIGIIDDKEACLKYMIRLSYPAIYNEKAEFYGLDHESYKLFEAYYDNASKAVDKLAELDIMKSSVDYSWKNQPYGNYQDQLQESIIRGRSLYPTDDKDYVSGADLINFLLAYLDKNKVKMYKNCQVINLIIEEQQAKGVIAINNGKFININAKKGVFFGSGGFSHNLKMINDFQPGSFYGGCAVPSNEGDLINIALKNGLKLGNLQNAYRVQSIVEAYLNNPGGASSMFYHIGDSTFQVNKYGQRFMNEKSNYNDRTLKHFVWDENKAEWPNRFSFMIFDHRCATLWQGFPPFPVGDPSDSFYIISADSIDELGDKIQTRLDSLNKQVPEYKLDSNFTKNLKETVVKFNEYARSGKDLDFERGDYVYDQEYTTFPPTIPGVEWPDTKYPNNSLHPLSEEGPYYAIILGAGSLDTNGGVVVNEKAQVIDAFNKVVNGLYAGGNCIAAFSKAAYYGAGGTIGPAFANAYIAIEDLSKK